jgi:hypothetical protein
VKIESVYGGNQRVCLGDKVCYAEVTVGQKKKGGAGAGAGSKEREAGSGAEEGPRCDWHGEYFRQIFYKDQVPQLLEGLMTEDPRRLQLSLAVLINGVKRIHDWFCEKVGADPKKYQRFVGDTRIEFAEIIELVKPLKPLQVEYLMAEACVKTAFEDGGRNYEIVFSGRDRAAIAEFLGIDFGKFRVDLEWINKKTKGELVRFLFHESLISQEEVFQEYCQKTLMLPWEKAEQKIAGMKKAEVGEIILNCGVDLAGRVPKEILTAEAFDNSKNPTA